MPEIGVNDCSDDAPAAVRLRLEIPSCRTYCADVAAFIEHFRASHLTVSHCSCADVEATALFEAERGEKEKVVECLRHVLYRVLLACWSFAGRATDCFESVRQFSCPSLAIGLLTTLGGYEVSPSQQYLQLRSVNVAASCGAASSKCRGSLAAVPFVGSLACALTEWLDQQQCMAPSASSLSCYSAPRQLLLRLSSFRLTIVGCRRFLWDISQNVVPTLSAALSGAEIVVAYDSVITHAGSQEISRVNGFVEFSTHFQYGVGVSLFAKCRNGAGVVQQTVGQQMQAVSCGTFVNDWLVGHVVMLAPGGPLIVHVHALGERNVPTESMKGFPQAPSPMHCDSCYMHWCSELLSTPTSVLVLVSGPRAQDAALVFAARLGTFGCGLLPAQVLAFSRGGALRPISTASCKDSDAQHDAELALHHHGIHLTKVNYFSL
jgi:hypothetical protein